MANAKYSYEQKVEFCKTYRKESDHTGIIFAEKMAAWLNKEKHLDPPLHGYDFRRPNDIKEFLDRVNDEIRRTVRSSDGVIHVISTPQLNVERILKKCRTRRDLQKELQKINKRFCDLIDTNQKLASALETRDKDCEKYKQTAEEIEKDLQRVSEEKESELKKLRKKLKQEKDENLRIRKVNRDQLMYIQRYISDPIIHKHISEELMLFNTDPKKKIELPECIRKMLGMINLEDVIKLHSSWNEELFDGDELTDDDGEDGEEDDLSGNDPEGPDPDDYTILTKAESETRDRLNKL